MSIIKTITNEYEFAEWVKQSDNYSNNFTFNGANTLQAYLEEYSEETGENIEFDPIAWCCEFSEYASFEELQSDYSDITSYDELLDRTTVIGINNTERFIISQF